MSKSDHTSFAPPADYTELDTQGLNCPEPVMMLHAEVRKVSSGGVIRVLATDPSTQRDIPRFCQFLGHELIHTGNGDDGTFEYWIRTAAS
ncbi:sulfurtransferase TusA [Natronospirillum operosum]|uniref:Sulfurtransferase TusA n=1 Tax=Natronospirillum operosum TaxID=2759953 RepID=A0A4Z0W9U0_9GAMM|nr:sulfurtransferase TusA [Natronospirillum operosum]TGG94912.1 sulfurtransferase TusA [Natronospirillum operosum]